MPDLEEQFKAQPLMDSGYRKKKLINYLIRTLVAIALYWYFWSVSWVPFTLWFYIPLNLAGLFMIVILPRILASKMRKAQERMEEAQAIEVEGEIIED